MVRILGAGVLILLLAGCATSGAAEWWRSLAGPAPALGRFHFGWRIAGDPAVAPLQVFDDGHRTWLQYPAGQGQAVPAFFERTKTGDRLLLPRREGDYLVFSGVPGRIVVRGGPLQAQVWRAVADTPSAVVGDAPLDSMTEPAFGPVSGAESVPELAPAPASVLASVSASTFAPVQRLETSLPEPGAVLTMGVRSAAPLLAGPPPLVPSAVISPAVAPSAADAAPRAAVSVATGGAVTGTAPDVVVGGGLAGFQVSPADGNIRRALVRWARVANWVFEPEHWAVDVDIPLVGPATFDPDFIPAVRDLLAATELGERPLQPCFYANRVLRVVPLAQRCDRTQAPAGVAS